MNTKEFLKDLGNKIAEQRKAKGKTALDVCAVIDMEKSNYSAIENGRQNPTALTLKKIADAIGVSVTTLFDF